MSAKFANPVQQTDFTRVDEREGGVHLEIIIVCYLALQLSCVS